MSRRYYAVRWVYGPRDGSYIRRVFWFDSVAEAAAWAENTAHQSVNSGGYKEVVAAKSLTRIEREIAEYYIADAMRN